MQNYGEAHWIHVDEGAHNLSPMMNSLSAHRPGLIGDLTTDVMLLSSGPLTFTVGTLFIRLKSCTHRGVPWL